MHVEVPYPIGSEVLVRLRVKGVGLTPKGTQYICTDPDNDFFNSIAVPEALLAPALATEVVKEARHEILPHV